MTFLPEISDGVVAFIRIAYGILLLGTLASALPQARRFFLSERWGGYARSSRAVDAIQNPIVMPFVLALWALCAVLLIVGVWTVPAAVINLVLARYFCIWMRWRGALRGMGAPGFMTYWLAVAVFVLEATSQYARDLRPLGLFALQFDLALIFLAAGLYKVRSGYPQNSGMEFGLTNPQWGYWWRFYRRLPPRHALFRALNHLAWMTELGASLLMLLPPTRFAGGLLLIATFAFIATQIRLGLLCEMVMLAGVLFFAPDTIGAHAIETVVVTPATAATLDLPPWAHAIAASLIVAYIVVLPFAYAGLVHNFYFRTRLPGRWQWALETYTNAFGIILWRVFSADLVNFTVSIRGRARSGGADRQISDYRNAWGNRFAHVCEMIAITSLFTTLKYYPTNTALFRERVGRYARTLGRLPDELVVFEYESIRKEETGFSRVPVAEFVFDPASGDVTEHAIDPSVSVRAVTEHSPVHEGTRPGSYAPPPLPPASSS